MLKEASSQWVVRNGSEWRGVGGTDGRKLYVLQIPSRQGTLGQTVRLPAAPAADPASETWPRAQKFGGAPTPLFIVRSVASPSWSVERGFSLQPAELAALLIRGGHARPARLDEMPTDE
jgi:hypothetical protein